MPMDAAGIGVLAAVSGALIGWLTFWLKFSDRISKAENSSADALQTAAEAREDIKIHSDRLTAMQASFSLYREQAIEKFVMHDTITAVETRLIKNQAQAEQRLADAIDGMNKRFDRFIEAGLAMRRD
jgi:hypothetical protein